MSKKSNKSAPAAAAATESPAVKAAAEDSTPEVVETPKAPAKASKPDKFVKLLKGTQFTDRDTGDIYILDRLTPVAEISNWVRMQAERGLFEIVE